MSILDESFEAMQQIIVETNQQLIEACAHMMTHLNQPISTTSPDQVQEFYQLLQIEFNGKRWIRNQH